MKNKNLLSLLCLTFFAFVLVNTACKKDDPEDTCVTTNMSYKDDIKPILTSNGCMASSCHGGSNTSGAINYTTYAGLKTNVDAMRLLGAIKREAGFSPMPKNGTKMSDCNISKVEAWVTQGAKDN